MLTTRNQQNSPVDWWFIYKSPEHTGHENNKGFDFFFFDAASGKLTLSPNGLDSKEQALAYTLSGIFNSPESSGFIVYNDEHADKKSNHSDKGHCKGILAFDKESDSALFLLHSTPRFPARAETTLPQKEAIYGQTYICLTLPDYQTANRIAAQMLSQQNPQILTESSRLPSNITEEEALYQLFHGRGIDESKQPSTLTFRSKGGKSFSLIAKSRKWGEDFWLDLISPSLKCDLVVESWRRGTVTPMRDGRSGEFDEDVLSLNFSLTPDQHYEWHYTKDHAKWAVAINNDGNSMPWVCVADINRMVSQEQRGGGSLCFQDEQLWQALSQAEEKLHKPLE